MTLLSVTFVRFCLHFSAKSNVKTNFYLFFVFNTWPSGCIWAPTAMWYKNKKTELSYGAFFPSKCTLWCVKTHWMWSTLILGTELACSTVSRGNTYLPGYLLNLQPANFPERLHTTHAALSDKSVQLEAERRLLSGVYFWIHYLYNLMLGTANLQ